METEPKGALVEPKSEPKRRGRKPGVPTKKKADNFVTPEDFQLSAKALTEVLYEASQPKIQNDQELYQRFCEYFQRCISSDRIPTIEECMISTGYSYGYLNHIRNGTIKPPAWASKNTPEIIAWASEVVKCYNAKMVLAGKLPQIPYIFRAKAVDGMSDTPQVNVVNVYGNEQELTAEDIVKRYSIHQTFPEDAERKPAESAES